MKNKFYLIICLLLLTYGCVMAQSVEINPASSSSAIISSTSTNKGLLVPRMTDTQRAAIASPATGLMVYQTNGTTGFYFWNGTTWVNLGGSGGTASELQKITEGSNTGWRILGRDAANYGDIGVNALDLSASTAASTTKGATGTNALATGTNTTASGFSAIATGLNTNAAEYASTAMGAGSKATGFVSIAAGNEVLAKSFGELAIGSYNDTLTTVNSTGFAGDNNRIFTVGTGTAFARRTSFVVQQNGNVGIGASSPNAQLQLGNTITNRKVVLFEVANNDHQYYGLGINNQVFRYQVDNTISSHAFYAATSTTASNELMRITGTGNVGIGTNAPSEKLDVAGSVRIVDGTQGDGKVLTSDANGKATWTTIATGGTASELQKITEASNTGWRILGRDPNYYGNIGNGAIDLSYSSGASTTVGATGAYALATGDETTASGNFSTALGIGTTASGNGSTALGSVTTSSGSASTSMGVLTKAQGTASFAAGLYVNAKSYGEFAIGSYNDTLTTVNSTLFAGDNNRIFTVGTGTSNSARRTSFVVQQNGNVGIGTGAPSEKLDVAGSIKIVDGTQGAGKVLTSDANGRGTWTTPAASGTASELQKITEGSNTGWRILGRDAANHGDIGANALDLSRSTLASTTTGATGPDAFAAGFVTTASGTNSTAMGNSTNASGMFSTAMGSSSIASGQSSTAIGSSTTASGQASTAMGISTTSSGQNATAMGSLTTASGGASTAMGSSTIASGPSSTAMGDVTIASGNRAIAMGQTTIASGDASTAMGISTRATQYASTAMGAGSRATGVVSTAIGNELIAKSATEFVVGSFNDTLTTFNATGYVGDNNRTFTVGTGSTNTARRTSFVVQQNGNVGIGTSVSNAQLQLGNTVTNRKIVLFDGNNNDNQYFGLGINASMFRYQVDGTGSVHAFFAGASTTASNELMRITGTGNVGIGNSNPLAPLHFANTQANRKIVLQQGGANDDHQFYGFGVNSETLRYQIAGNSSGNAHVFYAANTGLASSTELMRIQGNGYVGMGTTAPTANLMVEGIPGPSGLVTFSGLNYGSHFFAGATQDTYIRGGKIGSHVYINNDAVIGNVKIGAGGIPTEKLDITGNLKVTGNICYTGTIGACSDLRYKTNFSKIENPLNKVLSLNGLHYDWKVEEFKENNFTKDRQIGFIAQEIEEIFPEMVLTDAKGYKSVDYARLTPVLVEAIKELKTLNDELKGKNEKLEENSQKIEARLSKIEALLYK